MLLYHYVYLPLQCIYIFLNVIAAVSGSGAIEAVPLAIFAVSAIVALVSVIYLIRLAVSRAGDKIDFSGEEELGSRGQQQQNLVEGGRINTWKKTSEDMDKKKEMAELEIEMAKVGVERAKVEVERTKVEIGMANLSSHIEEKQDSRSQMDVARAIPQNSNASLPSPSGGAPPPPPPPSSNGTPLSKKADSPVSSHDAMLNQIRQGKKLRNKEESDERLEKMLDSKGDQLLKKADSPVDIQDALLRRVEKERICSSSDSNLSGPPNSDDWSNNGGEEQDKQSFAPAQADASIEGAYETDSDEELENYENKFLNSQPDNKRESTDSGFEDRFRPVSPVDPEQKTEESPVPPGSRVDSPSAVQVNNVNPVDNKVQDPSTSSIKDHRKFFDSIGGVANPSK